MKNEKVLTDTLIQMSQIDETDNQAISYILDTNILLHVPFAFLSFKAHDVIVPMALLETLYSIKCRRKNISLTTFNACRWTPCSTLILTWLCLLGSRVVISGHQQSKNNKLRLTMLID